MSGGATPLRAVRVEPELWDTARTIAAKNGDTISDIIREAIRAYIQENEDK
jgi:predicted DNA-binding protein